MSNIQDNFKTMNKELRQIMEHAQALVDATSGELDDRVKSARAALKERLESAKGEYGELENQLLEKVQAADKFVHAKPVLCHRRHPHRRPVPGLVYVQEIAWTNYR